MSTTLYAAIVVIVWVTTGLGATLFFLGRQGYRGWRWYLLGGTLGLLFVPIAAERARRNVMLLERAQAAVPVPEEAADGCVTVVVGVAGSDGSDQAVRDAARLFAGANARIVLVTGVDPDVGEFVDEGRRQRCHDMLVDRAAWLPQEPVPPVIEIGCGQPARVLQQIAETENADVVVLGRRGSGLSHRLLGSVAEHASRHSAVPVLLAESPRRERRAGRASTPEKRDAAEGSRPGAASPIPAGTSRPTAS